MWQLHCTLHGGLRSHIGMSGRQDRDSRVEESPADLRRVDATVRVGLGWWMPWWQSAIGLQSHVTQLLDTHRSGKICCPARRADEAPWHTYASSVIRQVFGGPVGGPATTFTILAAPDARMAQPRC